MLSIFWTSQKKKKKESLRICIKLYIQDGSSRRCFNLCWSQLP
uniref:Uncharacterized protein n=1 Tax=Ciona intestinalis TaxID=7719 RepID=H2XUS9_CIOIN